VVAHHAETAMQSQETMLGRRNEGERGGERSDYIRPVQEEQMRAGGTFDGDQTAYKSSSPSRGCHARPRATGHALVQCLITGASCVQSSIPVMISRAKRMRGALKRWSPQGQAACCSRLQAPH